MLQEAGIAQEGPGKHLYFAARALLLDKEVLAALQALRSHIPPAEKVQVRASCFEPGSALRWQARGCAGS